MSHRPPGFGTGEESLHPGTAFPLLLATIAWQLLAAPASPVSAQPIPDFRHAWSLEVDDHTLVRPSSIAIDASDRIWVTDPGGEGLARWDGTGRFLGRAGRPGRGPGEYIAPALVLPAPGGGVQMFDPSLPQVLGFDESGAFIRTLSGFSGVSLDVLREAKAFTVVDESDLLVWTASAPTHMERSFEGNARRLLLRGDGSGATEELRVPLSRHVVERDRLNVMAWSVPHTDGPLAAFLPGGGELAGSTRSDTLWLKGGEGRPDRPVVLGVADRAVTPGDRAAAVAHHRAAFALELQTFRDTLTEEIERFLLTKAERLLDQVEREIPDTAARVSHLAVGPDGVVWVLQAPLASDRAHTWLRIDVEQARVTCRARTDHRGRVTAASGTRDTLVVLEMEEAAFPRIVRLDLPEGVCR